MLSVLMVVKYRCLTRWLTGIVCELILAVCLVKWWPLCTSNDATEVRFSGLSRPKTLRSLGRANGIFWLITHVLYSQWISGGDIIIIPLTTDCDHTPVTRLNLTTRSFLPVTTSDHSKQTLDDTVEISGDFFHPFIKKFRFIQAALEKQ